MNASQYRKNRFEFGSAQQGANSFRVLCTERDVHGSNIQLELSEEAFSDEQMQRWQDALGMIEEVFAEVFSAKEAEHDPAAVHDLIRRGELAKVETARLEAEAIVKRAELDAEIEAKQELIAALEASVASKRE